MANGFTNGRLKMVGWLEFNCNVPFQHKYGYIRDEIVENNEVTESMI